MTPLRHRPTRRAHDTSVEWLETRERLQAAQERREDRGQDSRWTRGRWRICAPAGWTRQMPACAARASMPPEENTMNINLHLSLAPIISLVAGVLILIMPKLLNFIVAIYLIAIGLIGIFGVR